MGLFIALEGIDGAGKTTQALILAEHLRQQKGLPVTLIHEPGGTDLGEAIKTLVTGAKDPSKGTTSGISPKPARAISINPLAELLLFAASRTQLVEEVLRPALQEGAVVISDRFSASSVAYQGYGRGVDPRVVEAAITLATQGLQPHLTILLDLDVKEALSRKKGAAGLDRFEEEDLAFHERVREGYLKMAAEDPSRWAIINAGRPREEVAEAVWGKVESYLGKKPPGTAK